MLARASKVWMPLSAVLALTYIPMLARSGPQTHVDYEGYAHLLKQRHKITWVPLDNV